MLRKIKKNLYGRAQSASAIFPAGFGDVALSEIKTILATLWFPQKFVSELSVLKNEIRIDSIHLFALTEILMRSHCLTDLRLIIAIGKVATKKAFEKKCCEIDWGMLLGKNMSVKIKVNSVASLLFHESGLKEIISKAVAEHAEVVSGEDAQEATSLYVDLHKNKLTISLSLAGEPLYKRGYRGVLSASAPLREDIAACCIKKSLADETFSPRTVLVPFSGTGTFIFEYLLLAANFSPVLLGRDYALQRLPFFRQENFNFLLKKARENALPKSDVRFIGIDNSEQAHAALLENSRTMEKYIQHDMVFYHEDFFAIDVKKLTLQEDVFLPLNPPYGMRLAKHSDPVKLYKNIAEKINEIAQGRNILGFILCPSEETWSGFYKNLARAKINTYHIMQGGLDIRVCQFLILSDPLSLG